MSNMSTLIRASLNVTDFNSGTTGPAVGTPSLSVSGDWGDGIGADQADVFWSDMARTIAPSGSETLDFAGGSLLNALRVSASFAKVKALFIHVPASNPGLGVFITPGTNGVTGLFGTTAHVLRIVTGGSVLMMNPTATGIFPVTGATADLLTVNNLGSTNAVTYSIMVVGTSS